MLCAIFSYAIPDRAWQLEEKIKIEQFLIKEVLNLNIDKDKLENEKNHENSKETPNQGQIQGQTIPGLAKKSPGPNRSRAIDKTSRTGMKFLKNENIKFTKF